MTDDAIVITADAFEQHVLECEACAVHGKGYCPEGYKLLRGFCEALDETLNAEVTRC